MNDKPKLLDLYCGGGGCSYGYMKAGFDVTGVDLYPQKRYADGQCKFVQDDSLAYLIEHWRELRRIHASPECQGYSVTVGMDWAHGKDRYIPAVRAALEATGKLWVIENVPGSECDMPTSCVLCGLSFGLKLFRHRLFDSNILLLAPAHTKHKGNRVGVNGFVCMAGHGDSGNSPIPADHRSVEAWKNASKNHWMTQKQLSQSIPWQYTEYIGNQLMRALS